MPHARATALLILLVTATAVSGAPSRTPAQKLGTKRVSALTGQCTHLAFAGRLIEAPCNEQAFGTIYPNGRVAFAFSVDGKFTLQFAGDGARKQAVGSLGSMQPIDAVTFGLLDTGPSGRPQRLKATGKCVYGDAFSGEPIRIVCEGATAKGKFEVTFETDGDSPG
jgi:hypothetical protein